MSSSSSQFSMGERDSKATAFMCGGRSLKLMLGFFSARGVGSPAPSTMSRARVSPSRRLMMAFFASAGSLLNSRSISLESRTAAGGAIGRTISVSKSTNGIVGWTITRSCSVMDAAGDRLRTTARVWSVEFLRDRVKNPRTSVEGPAYVECGRRTRTFGRRGRDDPSEVYLLAGRTGLESARDGVGRYGEMLSPSEVLYEDERVNIFEKTTL